MPPPQVSVDLTLRLLKRSDDPVPDGEVRCLQLMLVFASGEYSPFDRALRPSDGVDGLFGPNTEGRVRRFQADEDLDIDGVVGRDTWTALFQRWQILQTSAKPA